MKMYKLAVAIGSVVASTAVISPFAAAQGQHPTGSAAAQKASAVAAKPGVTQEQRQRLAEKLRLIDQLVASLSRDPAFTTERAEWLRQAMYAMKLEQVRAVGLPATFQAASDAIVKAKTNTKLGDYSSDLVYVPWPPCRYIDTRNVAGKISGIRAYDLDNDGGAYGGIAACNPDTLAGVTNGADDIAALTLNITIVDTSTAGSPGFATIRPAGSTVVSALVNWTVSSVGFQLGNAATVSTLQDQGGNSDEFEIQTSGSVHAIVDISGAFIGSRATALDCLSPLSFATSTPLAAGTTSGYTYSLACTAGYTSVGGACYDGNGISGNMYLQAQGVSSSLTEYFCVFRNLDAASRNITVWNRCCRVPGR